MSFQHWDGLKESVSIKLCVAYKHEVWNDQMNDLLFDPSTGAASQYKWLQLHYLWLQQHQEECSVWGRGC